VAKKEKTIMCGSCTKVECSNDYPEGIPTWCAATRFHEIIEQTKTKYSAPDNLEIYLASGKVGRKGQAKWPRIQEAIEFAKELKLNRIGLASCVALISELRLIEQLFHGAGFEVVSSACQIGLVSPEDRGVNIDTTDIHSSICNPIAQAEICNEANTQLNYIMGLCLGHDILFMRHSKAPVSVLIVKDRVTGNNPAAALYGHHLRQSLLKTYSGK
jgi:uncharacterized metal-binding protein